MVVSKRILVNTSFLFDFSILTEPQEPSKNITIDIKVGLFHQVLIALGVVATTRYKVQRSHNEQIS